MGILTIILLLPVIGAIIIALLPRPQAQVVRRLAVLTSGLCLLTSWSLLARFDSTIPDLQLLETIPWNPRLGTSYALGIDGISLPLILLATVLCFLALLSSHHLRNQSKGYYLLMLLLQSALLGVFMAQDWSLFYVFWELTLIPLFFLIDRWGGERRHQAALNFVLYTMGGSVFMLISLLVIFDALPTHTFAMPEMLVGARSLDETKQIVIFLGFLIGFGVKMPIVFLHGWLPLAHVQAPSPVSILLSGILLKMGGYGLIRAAGMLPAAVISLQDVLMAVALFSLIYGGLLAWRQTDLKAMIAYSSISHMGVVLLGIATLNIMGLTGAVMQMVAHGLVAGALFLLIGLLYELTHTRNINDYSSLVRTMPRFSFFTVFAFIGAMGMPGTAGFVAELHTLIGGFSNWGGWIVLLSLGVLISAAYGVRTILRLFTGPVRDNMRNIPDLKNIDFVSAGVLTAGIVVLGVFPSTLLGLISASIKQLSNAFTG